MGNDLYSAVYDIFVSWDFFAMSRQCLHVDLNGISDHIEYPIPLNVFSGPKKLRKYDWIEVECKKAEEKLGRKESYRVRDRPLKIIDRNLSLRKANGR